MASATARSSTHESRGGRSVLARAVKIVVIAVLFVVLVPYLLVPLYRVANPVSTLMLWRWMTGKRVERQVMPIARMAPSLPLSVIVAEDGQFCQHRGVDWRGLGEAFREAETLSEARGGSAITQQVAK